MEDNFNFKNVLDNSSDIKAAYDEMLLALKERFPSDIQTQKLSIKNFEIGVLKCLTNKELLVSGEKVNLRRACIFDADFISNAEQLPDNSPWVGNWPFWRRIEKMGDSDFLQTIIEDDSKKSVGFIIFRDIEKKSEFIELKRIAVIEKGKGYGKGALHLAQKLAFEIFNAKKLYLHTKTENIRAQEIYKHTGFTAETADPCTSFFINAKDYFERYSKP